MSELKVNGLHQISLLLLMPSKTNPRKFFDEKELADLATSIKEKGVLEPLLVRVDPHHAGAYEIVAGERRFRASKLAKSETAPCIVRELNDQQVAEIQVVENMQRQDLTPMEEARGYQLLHEKHKYSWEDLAAKIGKSQSYIYARLRLLELHPKILKLVEEGVLQVSYATELQRIQDKDDQLKALEEVNYPGAKGYGDINSVKELRDYINEHFMLALADAPFDTKDAQLVPVAGPCALCPKRTGAQGSLFGDAGKKDSCLDAGCWGGKLKAHQAAITEKMKAKGQDVVHLKKGERFNPDSKGLVLLTERDYDLKGNKTWKTALTDSNAMDKISPIAVINTEGKTEIYAHKKEIVAALPKSAWNGYVPSVRDHGMDGKKNLTGAARIKRLVDLASVREVWPKTWPIAIDKLQDMPLTGDTLRGLVNVIVHDVIRYPLDNEVRDRAGSKIEARLSAAKSDKELRRLLWDLALGIGLYPGNTTLTSAGLKVFRQAKVDWTAALKQTIDKKMAERKAKAATKKAAAPPKSVTAELKKKGFVKTAAGGMTLPSAKTKALAKKVDKSDYTNVVASPADLKAKKKKVKK